MTNVADKKGKILIIDDSESVLFLLENILSIDFEVVSQNRANKALQILDTTFDTIIIDLMMPEMSGIEFIKEVRKDSKYEYIPMIVLTAKHNTEEDIARLFEMGASDYISKPFFSSELVARVKTHSKLKILTENLIDANKKLKYSATHDELTNSYNRNAIFDFLDNEILRLKRTHSKLVLMIFDVDYFKDINDTYGHQVGDFVLAQIICLIREIVRETDLIGRYGGDEFVIILPDADNKKGEEIANRILKKINNEKIIYKKQTLTTSISLGLSEYKNDEGIDSFLERVDKALYDAKNSGRNCYKIR